MRKYIVLVRQVNDPDNNTPSDQIWCEVSDYEDNEVNRVESMIANDFIEDVVDVDVKIIPLEELQDDMTEVFTIW